MNRQRRSSLLQGLVLFRRLVEVKASLSKERLSLPESSKPRSQNRDDPARDKEPHRHAGTIAVKLILTVHAELRKGEVCDLDLLITDVEGEVMKVKSLRPSRCVRIESSRVRVGTPVTG